MEIYGLGVRLNEVLSLNTEPEFLCKDRTLSQIMRQYSNCLVEQRVTVFRRHLFDERQWDIVLLCSLRRREILFRLHLTPYRGNIPLP